MHAGIGQIAELILRDGLRHARITCTAGMIPSPGQYLLASNAADSPLPVPIYYTDSAPEGFLAVPIPAEWMPGSELHLRGPLGRGFEIPAPVRKIALIPFVESTSGLFPLIRPALNQGAAIVLVKDSSVDDLPDEVEVQPRSAVGEVLAWADWVALDVGRDHLAELHEWLEEQGQARVAKDAAVLLRTSISCGGVAECGVCAVMTKAGWKMACKDGPVFTWDEFSIPNSK